MQFKNLIKEFMSYIKVDANVEIDEDIIPFTIDDMQISIIHSPELDSVLIVGNLGEPPPENLETLYRTMLDANFQFTSTAGATLSREAESGNFMLSRCIPLKSLDCECFVKAIESFANAQSIWTKIISDYRDSSTNHPSEKANEETPLNDFNMIRI